MKGSIHPHSGEEITRIKPKQHNEIMEKKEQL
jgi:hypothetical protein